MNGRGKVAKRPTAESLLIEHGDTEKNNISVSLSRRAKGSNFSVKSYSDRMLSIGFAKAALTLCIPTVSNEIKSVRKPASTNICQEISIR